jgi:hypothetical protein
MFNLIPNKVPFLTCKNQPQILIFGMYLVSQRVSPFRIGDFVKL